MSFNEALSSLAEGFIHACKTPTCAQPTTSNDNTCTNANTYTLEEKKIKSSTLRSKYIEQLKELYQLFESTAITN